MSRSAASAAWRSSPSFAIASRRSCCAPTFSRATIPLPLPDSPPRRCAPSLALERPLDPVADGQPLELGWPLIHASGLLRVLHAPGGGRQDTIAARPRHAAAGMDR